MTPQPIPASSLQSTYAQLRDDLSVAAVPVTDRFWSDLAGGIRPELDEGRLVLLLHHTQGPARPRSSPRPGTASLA